MMTGALHRAFSMEDASRVGEARRHAAWLSAEAGLDETEAGRVAIVVTELGNNLVRHAKNGQLLLASRAGSVEVEVISFDEGPGIAHVQRAMNDGFSTGSTPGTGLGAVRRLADDFDIHSAVPDGTVILARMRGRDAPAAPLRVEVRGVAIAAPGETECGDGWAAAFDGERACIVVADGLGHGPDAAKASRAAIEAFSEDPFAAPAATLERIHARLRTTRGAAVTVLMLDAAESRIRSSGAGNVVARHISGVSDRSMMMQHGTAGVQIRRPDEVTQEWPAHAMMVIHSDGIEMRWNADRVTPLLGSDPSLAAAILLRDHCRGRDDATIVVARRKGARS